MQWKTGRLRQVRSEISTLPFVGLTSVGEGPQSGTGVQHDWLLHAATQPLCLLAHGVLAREVVVGALPVTQPTEEPQTHWSHPTRLRRALLRPEKVTEGRSREIA